MIGSTRPCRRAGQVASSAWPPAGGGFTCGGAQRAAISAAAADSPSQHATAHARDTDHSVIQSFEPGEDWFWDYATAQYAEGPPLAPPDAHPPTQPVPGPEGAVPRDWQRQLN